MDQDRQELPALVKVYAYQFYHHDRDHYMTAACYATREQIDRRNADTTGAGAKPWLLKDAEYLEVDPSRLKGGFYYVKPF